jgi:hypothetical protein
MACNDRLYYLVLKVELPLLYSSIRHIYKKQSVALLSRIVNGLPEHSTAPLTDKRLWHPLG